ncbi:MAG: CAP domain-containing protein [Demequina sp.]
MTTGRCARASARARTLAAAAAAAVATAAAATAATLALAGCTNQPEPLPADHPSPGAYAQVLFDLTNDERTQAGLDPLTWSDCLVEPALDRAQVAADADSLEHQVLALDCARGAMAGENLSRADVDAQEIVRRWMASPGHEANIVMEAFVEGAVGCVADGEIMTCSWLAQGVPPTAN